MRIYQVLCREAVIRVKEGDGFEGLADMLGTIPENITAHNGGAKPAAGDLLFVPDLDRVLYTVQPLDTVESVAERFNVRADDILPAGLKRLYLGQKLAIKAGDRD